MESIMPTRRILFTSEVTGFSLNLAERNYCKTYIVSPLVMSVHCKTHHLKMKNGLWQNNLLWRPISTVFIFLCPMNSQSLPIFVTLLLYLLAIHRSFSVSMCPVHSLYSSMPPLFQPEEQYHLHSLTQLYLSLYVYSLCKLFVYLFHLQILLNGSSHTLILLHSLPKLSFLALYSVKATWSL